MKSLFLKAWHIPSVHNAVIFGLQLGSINSEFWVLAWGTGGLIAAFHAMLLDDLGDVIAIAYNTFLAIMFSAMIFLSASGGAKSGVSLWREIGGFVFLYIALGAAYMNIRSKKLDAYGQPGFLAGLLSYLIFGIHPKLAAHPGLLGLYGFLDWIAWKPLGWAMAAFSAVEMTWVTVRAGAGRLPSILWPLGLAKHPPIRIRKRTD